MGIYKRNIKKIIIKHAFDQKKESLRKKRKYAFDEEKKSKIQGKKKENTVTN